MESTGLQSDVDLAKWSRKFIKNGADMERPHTKPPKEAPPYPIKPGLLKNLASKMLIDLHNQKKFLGPFWEHELPFPRDDIFLSPVFIKPKDLSRNKILFLFDFSAPNGASINSSILKEPTWVCLPTIQFYIKNILKFGPRLGLDLNCRS